ncbi:MAG: MBOAT family protein [Lentimicrobium sp.]
MKIAIADNCAETVNTIFTNSSIYSGSTLILGIFLFTVEIYADFAGYSNIAIGVGKLLGFNIINNFAYPYFARDIREFWKRWNISLTIWFRDYVFLPIAYSVSRKIKSDRFYFVRTEFVIYAVGITATWILTGLWHGANYTFIIWGLIHGVSLIINHVTAKPRKRFLKRLNIHNDSTILVIVDSLITFTIIMFSWIFFRANNLDQAFSIVAEIFSSSLFTIPNFPEIGKVFSIVFLIGIFLIVEWLGREQQFAIKKLGEKWYKPFRWAMYYAIILAIYHFAGSEQQFIYFQF